MAEKEKALCRRSGYWTAIVGKCLPVPRGSGTGESEDGIAEGDAQLYTREQIVAAVENSLNEREQQIIRTRFGLDNGVTVTLTEIESMYGVTREQIRSLEKRVLTYIKAHG